MTHNIRNDQCEYHCCQLPTPSIMLSWVWRQCYYLLFSSRSARRHVSWSFSDCRWKSWWCRRRWRRRDSGLVCHRKIEYLKVDLTKVIHSIFHENFITWWPLIGTQVIMAIPRDNVDNWLNEFCINHAIVHKLFELIQIVPASTRVNIRLDSKRPFQQAKQPTQHIWTLVIAYNLWVCAKVYVRIHIDSSVHSSLTYIHVKLSKSTCATSE